MGRKDWMGMDRNGWEWMGMDENGWNSMGRMDWIGMEAFYLQNSLYFPRNVNLSDTIIDVPRLSRRSVLLNLPR